MYQSPPLLRHNRFYHRLAYKIGWRLSLAVLLPVAVLLRLYLDADDRSLELSRRNLVINHQKLAERIENNYSQYRQAIRELGQEYQKDATLREFKGTKDPSLWFFAGKRFSEDIERRDPAGMLRHRMAYTRQFVRYRDSILQGVFGLEADKEVESPLRIQAWVLERSMKVAELEDNGLWTYDNVLPLQYRPDAPITDRHDFHVMLDGSKERRSFYRDPPVHPIFQSSDIVSRLIWEELVAEIPYRVYRALLFGENVGNLESLDLASIFNRNIMEWRNVWFPFAPTNALNIELLWNTIPSDFTFENYYSGYNNTEVPVAVFFAVINMQALRDTFLMLFDSNPQERKRRLSPEVLKTLDTVDAIRADLRSVLKELELNGIQFIVLGATVDYLSRFISSDERLRQIQLRPAEILKKFPGNLDANSIGLSMPESALHEISAHEILGIMNPKTGEYGIKGEAEVIEYFMKEYGIQESILAHLPLDLILRRCLAQKSAVSVAVQPQSNERAISSFVPSIEYPGLIYQFTEPTASIDQAARQRTNILYTMLLICGLAGVGGMLVLRAKTVNPILRLSRQIDRLKRGEAVSEDLAGNLLTARELIELSEQFDQMSQRIQIRVKSLLCIEELNSAMNAGMARQDLVAKLVLDCASIFGAKLVIAGLFEGKLSQNPSGWIVCGSSDTFDIVSQHLPDIEKAPASTESDLSEQLRFYRFEFSGAELPVSLHGCLIIRDFNPEVESGVLKVLADQAQSILIKTWLDEIGEDTRKGSEVQSSLMPKTAPDTKSRLELSQYFSAARGLAGDWFDLFTTTREEKEFLIAAVADVSGKGIGPALFGASSRAWLRAAIRTLHTPGELLTALNNFLQEGKTNNLFQTLFLLEIELDSGMMRYASGGHNRMFLIRADGNLEELSAKGMPIGMFSPLKFETKSVELKPGDQVILYTDGIPELENEAQDLYGMERFTNLLLEQRSLPLGQIQKSLLLDMDTFRQTALPSDDVTLVMIRQNGIA